mmetsp:Transcript_15189/g.25218  ORF Transcript_15189/g.25218 Transcript_15189/m.25218 type:complete len:293 (+) Transcript_15189:92-970(+)
MEPKDKNPIINESKKKGPPRHSPTNKSTFHDQDVKKNYEHLLHQAEQIRNDTAVDDYESTSKAKAKLAQLLGSIKKLQFTQFDAVTTTHVESGKAEAKTTHRELNASQDELQEFVTLNRCDPVTMAHLDSGKAEAKTTRRNVDASLNELKEFVQSLYDRFDAVPPPPPHHPPRHPVVTISSGGEEKVEDGALAQSKIHGKTNPQRQLEQQRRYAENLREAQLHAMRLREHQRQRQLRWQQEQQTRHQALQRRERDLQRQEEQQLHLRLQQRYYRDHNPRRYFEDCLREGISF